jgi:hypothetical protein
MNSLSHPINSLPHSLSIAIRVSGLALAAATLTHSIGSEVQRASLSGAVIVAQAPGHVEEVITVRDAPPPPRHEVIIERDRPSPKHVWVEGYWSWHGGRHVWNNGHWELPPRANMVWVAPRWEHRDRGYVFVAGSWHDAPVVVKERVIVQPSVSVNLKFIGQPPPPPRHEVIVESQRPSRDHVWIKGYYVWRDGRHVWLDGHWERPPHPHAVWVEPRWEKHPEGHVFIEGFWR